MSLTREFDKDLLSELAWMRPGENFKEGEETIEMVEKAFIEDYEDYILWKIIFKCDETLFSFEYYSRAGRGEYSPWEDQPEKIECEKVQAEEYTATRYITVKG